MQAPSTLIQLAILVVAVLPGVTYQFMRERSRGPLAAHKDVGERVLRALMASVVLNLVYLFVAGPWLVGLIAFGSSGPRATVVSSIREVSLVALAMFVVFPTFAAMVANRLERRKVGAKFVPIPSAWDFSFRIRTACFIRARLKDGTWVGGWFGVESFASSYPAEKEVFLESAWKMERDGRFRAKTPNGGGLLLRYDTLDFIEFVEP